MSLLMHLSEEMRSWKQRSLAAASRSSHLAVFKAQLSQHDFRTPCPSPGLLQPEPEPEPGESSDTTKQQSWSQWVGRKLARRGDSYDSTGSNGVDMITLFPGWATRRYQKAGGSAGAGVEGNAKAICKSVVLSELLHLDSFGVDVFISGYASNCRPPGLATRSQRAFLRLAKGRRISMHFQCTWANYNMQDSPLYQNFKRLIKRLDLTNPPSLSLDLLKSSWHLSNFLPARQKSQTITSPNKSRPWRKNSETCKHPMTLKSRLYPAHLHPQTSPPHHNHLLLPQCHYPPTYIKCTRTSNRAFGRSGQRHCPQELSGYRCSRPHKTQH